MAKAAEIAYQNLDKDAAYILSIKQYFIQQLQESFDDIQICGNMENSLYTVLNISFPNKENTMMLLFNLDIKGVCASGGSACSSGAATGSHVIQAILPNVDRVNVRFSFSKLNTTEEVDVVIQSLKAILV